MAEDRDFDYWEQRYEQEPVREMPWYFEPLDPDLKKALGEFEITGGYFLDLGTGPGTQAAALAKLGFRILASDIAASAVQAAERRYGQSYPEIQFVQDDILNSKLKGPFDAVFDRGCFHVLPPEKRQIYVAKVHELLAENGRLFLKTFSVKEPGEDGPYRLSENMIYNLFSKKFNILTIFHSFYQGNRKPPPKALFAILISKK